MTGAPGRPEDLFQFLDLLSGLQGDSDVAEWERVRRHLYGAVKSRMSRADNLRRVLDSEDLTQEALIDLVRHLDYFRGTTWAEFYSFLDTVIERRKADLARHHARMRRNGGARLQHLQDVESDASGTSPSSSAIKAEEIARLRHLVDALPTEASQIVHLRMQGLNYDEIARLLSISEITARKRISRAIADLRRHWNEDRLS